MGYGRKVGVVQFIKGKWPTGERRFAASLPNLDFYVMGKGFTWDSDDLSQDRALARKAWDKSKDLIQSGQYDVVILDEITYVINYGFVEVAEVVATLVARPQGVSVILTGRKAHPILLEIADVVTEMQEVKHPFKSGHKAQQGLDY
jgi:cob(I)alamin adenosyltransferase